MEQYFPASAPTSGDFSELSDAITKMGNVTRLHNGLTTTSTNNSLSENYTNFTWLYVVMQTNSELETMWIYVPSIDATKSYFRNVSLFNGTGQISDYSYKTSCAVKFHDSNKFDVACAYNNVNLQLRLLSIYGVGKA